jgi:hypothetical protein
MTGKWKETEEFAVQQLAYLDASSKIYKSSGLSIEGSGNAVPLPVV